jgi:lipid II:glycine glycyltransferase (peptidoglycan interpeptide bridge formation enzyme)
MDAYREFAVIYQEMLDRKEFKTTVDAGEFGRMQEQLPENHKMTIFLARKDGKVLGALVCARLGDTGIFVLGATGEAARKLKASYLLHWQAMLWLKAQGALWYDLSGIDPVSNPHGHQFKRGFGGIDATQIASVYASGGLLSRISFRALSMLRRGRR